MPVLAVHAVVAYRFGRWVLLVDSGACEHVCPVAFAAELGYGGLFESV